MQDAKRSLRLSLKEDDVKQVEAVWVFDIKTDEKRGQGLKNEASVRMVPVHSRLIELGLLQYVNQTRATGALRLFPRLKHGGNGFGDSVGKSFARHLKQVGIVDQGKVLHSLRHTVITRLHGRGVSTEHRRSVGRPCGEHGAWDCVLAQGCVADGALEERDREAGVHGSASRLTRPSLEELHGSADDLVDVVEGVFGEAAVSSIRICAVTAGGENRGRRREIHETKKM